MTLLAGLFLAAVAAQDGGEGGADAMPTTVGEVIRLLAEEECAVTTLKWTCHFDVMGVHESVERPYYGVVKVLRETRPWGRQRFAHPHQFISGASGGGNEWETEGIFNGSYSLYLRRVAQYPRWSATVEHKYAQLARMANSDSVWRAWVWGAYEHADSSFTSTLSRLISTWYIEPGQSTFTLRWASRFETQQQREDIVMALRAKRPVILSRRLYSGDVMVRETIVDKFTELGSGRHFPSAMSESVWSPRGVLMSRGQYVIDDIVENPPLTDKELELEVPPGVPITDASTNETLIVGRNADSLFARLALQVAEFKSLQASPMRRALQVVGGVVPNRSWLAGLIVLVVCAIGLRTRSWVKRYAIAILVAAVVTSVARAQGDRLRQVLPNLRAANCGLHVTLATLHYYGWTCDPEAMARELGTDSAWSRMVSLADIASALERRGFAVDKRKSVTLDDVARSAALDRIWVVHLAMGDGHFVVLRSLGPHSLAWLDIAKGARRIDAEQEAWSITAASMSGYALEVAPSAAGVWDLTSPLTRVVNVGGVDGRLSVEVQVCNGGATPITLDQPKVSCGCIKRAQWQGDLRTLPSHELGVLCIDVDAKELTANGKSQDVLVPTDLGMRVLRLTSPLPRAEPSLVASRLIPEVVDVGVLATAGDERRATVDVYLATGRTVTNTRYEADVAIRSLGARVGEANGCKVVVMSYEVRWKPTERGPLMSRVIFETAGGEQPEEVALFLKAFRPDPNPVRSAR